MVHKQVSGAGRWLFLVFTLATLNAPAIHSGDFSGLFEDAPLFPHCLTLKADFAYSGWKPNMSYKLNYFTTGLPFLKIETRFSHAVPFLPELQFLYETNFGNDNHQEELLAAHNSSSQIEGVYTKIKLAAGFGKLLDNFNPRRSNSLFDLAYFKETFYISVKPDTEGLVYAPFDSDKTRTLRRDEALSMVTKFEEIHGTFKTPGIAILPMVFSVLFMDEIEDVINFDDEWETRLGAYYATFQKPYMVSQAVSRGMISGDTDFIYNARFNAMGLVEKYGIYIGGFEFSLQHNLGAAWVELRKNELLDDTASLLFFHYKAAPMAAFHWSLLDSRVELSIGASIDWGFMWGGRLNPAALKFETSSFLNDDLVFKLAASMTIRI